MKGLHKAMDDGQYLSEDPSLAQHLPDREGRERDNCKRQKGPSRSG